MIFSTLPKSTNAFLVAYFVLQLYFWLPEEGNHFLVAYFVLQLYFRLPEEGNHQTHTLEVFNHTAHKVVKDTISYAHIQAKMSTARMSLAWK
jgi:hypothetical protein